MSRYVLFAVSVLLSQSIIRAQDGEHYFFVTVGSYTTVGYLTHMMSIDDVRGDTVYGYANDRQWTRLKELGYAPNELAHPSSLYDHAMSNSPAGLLDWDTYPTYQAYLAMMRQFASSHPTICRLDTIGLSVQGRQILAVKISDNAAVNESEPEFFYTSSIHGDELVGYVLMLRLVDYLLTQYGQPTPEGIRATKLVDSLEIWINPLANPDGTFRLGGDTTVNNARRYNAHNVDLNRNFPDRINDTVNTGAGREPETQAFMAFAKKHNIILSANFHGGAQVVNYPWDNGAPSGTYSACPDDAWFVHLSRTYANPNPDMLNGGFPNGITNGCQWYSIYGGRQDWMYWWQGGKETTIELWNTKLPAGSVLPQRWTNNKESFLAYMEEAYNGVHGLVTDSQTGRPVHAQVDVMGIATAHVYSDSAVGDFHRLLLPGSYSLIIRAQDYATDTLSNVVVPDSGGVRVTVQLRSLLTSENSREISPGQFALFQNYPNPFNPATTIRYSLPHSSFVTLTIYNILGQQVEQLVAEQEEAGQHEVAFRADALSSGVYLYRLMSGNSLVVKKLLLIR